MDLLLSTDFEPMLAIRGILETGQGEPVAVSGARTASASPSGAATGSTARSP